MSCKSKIFVVFWQNNIPSKYTGYSHQKALVLSPEKAMQMPKAHWKYLISTSSREATASRRHTQLRGVTLPEFHHLHPAQENKVQYKNTGTNEIHWNFVYLHTWHTAFLTDLYHSYLIYLDPITIMSIQRARKKSNWRKDAFQCSSKRCRGIMKDSHTEPIHM